MAIAAPMPLVPPVTNARFPVRIIPHSPKCFAICRYRMSQRYGPASRWCRPHPRHARFLQVLPAILPRLARFRRRPAQVRRLAIERLGRVARSRDNDRPLMRQHRPHWADWSFESNLPNVAHNSSRPWPLRLLVRTTGVPFSDFDGQNTIRQRIRFCQNDDVAAARSEPTLQIKQLSFVIASGFDAIGTDCRLLASLRGKRLSGFINR